VPACSRLFPQCHGQQNQPSLTAKEAAQGLRYENSLSPDTKLNTRPNMLPGKDK
ncbi:hypothetical protein STEG23_036243, partial [Scotinomys teguina]